MALKRCKTTFMLLEGSSRRVIRCGDIVDDDDDAYKKNKANFEPVRVTNFPRSRAVEQASAAPGEKRRVTRKAD